MAYGGRGRGSATSPAKRIRSIPGVGILPFVPRGRSAFDPAAHPALPGLQKRAAQALFAFYGQHWVPPEYFQILRDVPDPTAALRAFCKAFGLDPEVLRTGSASALEQFDLLNSHLIEIDHIRGRHGDAQAKRLVQLRQRAKAEVFESILNRFRSFCNLEDRATACFAAFEAVAYEELIAQCFRSVDLASIDDRILARNSMAVEWMERSEISRANAYDDWAAIVDGIVTERGADSTYDAFVFEGAQFMDRLQHAASPAAFQQVLDEWGQRIEEILHLGGREETEGRASTPPGYRGKSELLTVLGFRAGENPTYDMIKMRYRSLVKEHHPDTLPPSSTPEEKKTAHDRIVELNTAYDGLKRFY